ncbi:unnamed protein product [Ectocarpus sp. 12 AP-2014]
MWERQQRDYTIMSVTVFVRANPHSRVTSKHRGDRYSPRDALSAHHTRTTFGQATLTQTTTTPFYGVYFLSLCGVEGVFDLVPIARCCFGASGAPPRRRVNQRRRREPRWASNPNSHSTLAPEVKSNTTPHERRLRNATALKAPAQVQGTDCQNK